MFCFFLAEKVVHVKDAWLAGPAHGEGLQFDGQSGGGGDTRNADTTPDLHTWPLEMGPSLGRTAKERRAIGSLI